MAARGIKSGMGVHAQKWRGVAGRSRDKLRVWMAPGLGWVAGATHCWPHVLPHAMPCLSTWCCSSTPLPNHSGDFGEGFTYAHLVLQRWGCSDHMTRFANMGWHGDHGQLPSVSVCGGPCVSGSLGGHGLSQGCWSQLGCAVGSAEVLLQSCAC